MGTGDATCDQFSRNVSQSRLSRWRGTLIELIEPLAPPSEADHREVRIRTGRDNVGQREIEVPQSFESRPDSRRHLLQRDLSVVVELALSDR